MLTSTSSSTYSAQQPPNLSGQQRQQLEQLVAHPAWAAAQAYLSAESKAAVRRLLEGDSKSSVTDSKCAEARAVADDDDGALDDSHEERKPLEQEVKDLRQRVSTLQQKLSEAKQLEQG